MTCLTAAERLALNTARTMIDGGCNPEMNVVAVLVAALDRITAPGGGAEEEWEVTGDLMTVSAGSAQHAADETLRLLTETGQATAGLIDTVADTVRGPWQVRRAAGCAPWETVTPAAPPRPPETMPGFDGEPLTVGDRVAIVAPPMRMDVHSSIGEITDLFPAEDARYVDSVAVTDGSGRVAVVAAASVRRRAGRGTPR
jgi:hypothetical protein